MRSEQQRMSSPIGLVGHRVDRGRLCAYSEQVVVRGAERAGFSVQCRALAVACVLILSAPLATRLPAQDSPDDVPKKIPDKERLTLSTKDGVSLSCDYYPGGFVKMGDTIRRLDGKSVVPIILVHGWGGRGSDFDAFAAGLQMYGYAVMVPDLRGHGASTTARTAAGIITLDLDKMNSRELKALSVGMVEDIETVKRVLLQKNNEQLLNIELLGILGADTGALVAMNWAVLDWNKQQLPAFKQGRDVKAIALISPPIQSYGLDSRAFAAHPVLSKMPTFIAVGATDSSASRDADRLYKLLEKKHVRPDETLRLVQVETSLQGTQLLQTRGLPVANEALRFFYANLNEKASQYPWMDRTSPLGQ